MIHLQRKFKITILIKINRDINILILKKIADMIIKLKIQIIYKMTKISKLINKYTIIRVTY